MTLFEVFRTELLRMILCCIWFYPVCTGIMVVVGLVLDVFIGTTTLGI